MNAKEFSDLLTSLDACPRAREWAKGKSLQSAWKTCERGDWLLWLSGHMADKPGWPTRNEVVLAAGDCAETALRYVKAGDDGPRKCIATVRAWADGKATLDDVGTARRAAAASAASYTSYTSADADADAANAAASAAAAAAYAADAAASYVATAAASATYAPYATYASYAADAAAYAAADAAAYAAYADADDADDRTKTLAKCAVIVRKRLSIPKGELS